MFDSSSVWKTVAEEAESLIQREYGSNWSGHRLKPTQFFAATSSEYALQTDHCGVSTENTNSSGEDFAALDYSANQEDSFLLLPSTSATFQPTQKLRSVNDEKLASSPNKDDVFWEDLSALANADYRDLISALYDNLPNSPALSEKDEHILQAHPFHEHNYALTTKEDDFLTSNTVPTDVSTIGLGDEDGDFSLDAHFLHSQILPTAKSAGHLYEFIVQNANAKSGIVSTVASDMVEDSSVNFLTTNYCNTVTSDARDLQINNEIGDEEYHENSSRKDESLPFALDEEASTSESEFDRKENGHKCVFCDYSTKSRTQFWRHRKKFGHFEEIINNSSQTKSRKVPSVLICCAYCNYSTRVKFNMERHINRAHVSQRSVACPYCEKCFKDADTLRVHLTFMHEEKISVKNATKNVSEEASFNEKSIYPLNKVDEIVPILSKNNVGELAKKKCKECEKCFKTSSDLLRHFRIVHEKRRTFACTLCGKCFQTSANARRHFAKVCAKSDNANLRQC